MDKRIEKIKRVRQFLLAQIAGLSTEQLNKIPEGYKNNIIWNIGHLICAQQSICYFRAGESFTVDEKYIAPFRTGTKPQEPIDAQEIERMEELLLTSIDQFQADYEKGLFTSYSPSENILKVYGVELNSIEDAIDFVLYHEGFHSGYVLSLKRLVSGA